MEANEPIVDERLIALWEEGVLETAGELSLDLERARAKLRALLESLG